MTAAGTAAIAGPADTRVSEAMPAPLPEAALREALLDSRQRWRDLVTMAADFAFETDAQGRLVFIAPDPALGWGAAALLGQPADLLLADAGGASGFNPFRPTAPVRRRRGWLRRPDGGHVCLTFAAAPLLDSEGRIVGARGIGQDVTEQNGYDTQVAAALRRGELLDHILWRMRQEVLAPRMMQAALDALVTALGAEGCAVVDMIGDGVAPMVLHEIGASLPHVLHTAMTLLESGTDAPSQASAQDGRLVLVCPSRSRFGEQAGFVLWRQPGGRLWDTDELVLASSATGIIRVILEHDAIQREMARQARTDPLTGLFNRRAFLDEMARRVDRLERDGLPGTLMFVDLDNFKALNDCRGHDAGDEALCITGHLLRQTVRPSDLVARLGGDEFALWLDGADEFTAAERAESLRVEGPKALAHLTAGHDPAALSMSIGIATRWPGQGEDIEMLIHRADQVMYEVKRAGRGHWRVSRAERI
ncbi:sensor domain-containing diguanylate cyclase [Limobrevibacterium gyesilva]|uniref:diguanylate cyclase n=1 Tax=Limobrevibacterium gyesilva TaxID=2991712 RepID=A0AA41YQM0_9PROT|nr:sensor domain-containing diguanylate cyclase [Limobrevibacterium gyesilva]MCW3474833.1 sensor domain-containing diguanylate cyclase [Limobrevibacterium gyesilva]